MSGVSHVVMWDPTVMFSSKQIYSTYRGGSQFTWTPVVSTSWSDQIVSFYANPPDAKFVVNKEVYLILPIRLTFNGNTGDVTVPLLQPGETGCLRSWPISSITNNVQCQINNTTITNQMNPIMPYLGWVGNCQREEYIDVAQTPVYQDRRQTYPAMLGNPINPFGPSYPHQKKRGDFPYFVVSNSSTQAVIDVLLIEPLWFTPFIYGGEHEPGLVGVNTLNFQFNMGDLTRCWSQATTDAAHVITSYSATLLNVAGFPNAVPTLLFRYITMPTGIPAPIRTIHPLYNITIYTTNVGLQNSGTSFPVVSNNIQLGFIPTSMHIFVRRRDSDRTIYTTDTFASLNSIQVQWQNTNSIFAGATPLQLWQISKSNGVTMSYDEWTGYIRNVTTVGTNDRGPGSFFSLRFGKDIPLLENEAPGLRGNYQFYFNANYTNISTENINYTLYIVVINDGTLEIADQSAIQKIGSITPEEASNINSMPTVPYKEVTNFYGGTIWGKIPSFIRGAVKGVESALPYVKKAVDFAHSVGFGSGLGGCEKCANGGCESCGKSSGGRFIGREELRSMAENPSKKRKI